MSYESLSMLPIINGRTVIGDMMMSDLGLVPMSSYDVNEIMLEVFGYIL